MRNLGLGRSSDCGNHLLTRPRIYSWEDAKTTRPQDPSPPVELQRPEPAILATCPPRLGRAGKETLSHRWGRSADGNDNVAKVAERPGQKRKQRAVSGPLGRLHLHRWAPGRQFSSRDLHSCSAEAQG